jgi:hypothetical protein
MQIKLKSNSLKNLSFIFDALGTLNLSYEDEVSINQHLNSIKIDIHHLQYKGEFDGDKFIDFIDRVKFVNNLEIKHPNCLAERIFALDILKSNGVDLSQPKIGEYEVVKKKSSERFFQKSSGNISSVFSFVNLVGDKLIFSSITINKFSSFEIISKILIDKVENYKTQN